MPKSSANKTVATKVNVADFLKKLPDAERRADAQALLKLMQKATGQKPTMWGPSIIGFGSYHYVYDTGREGDMPLVSFSPRKAATVIYGLGGAKDLLPKLGKHATSGGCISVKKLADVDPKVLEAMVMKSVAATGKKHSS
jgi:hypothetical protein